MGLRDRMAKDKEDRLEPVLRPETRLVAVQCGQNHTESVLGLWYGSSVVAHPSVVKSKKWTVTLMPCGLAIVIGVPKKLANHIAQQCSAVPAAALEAFGNLGRPTDENQLWFDVLFYLSNTAAIDAGGISLRAAVAKAKQKPANKKPTYAA